MGNLAACNQVITRGNFSCHFLMRALLGGLTVPFAKRGKKSIQANFSDVTHFQDFLKYHMKLGDCPP